MRPPDRDRATASRGLARGAVDGRAPSLSSEDGGSRTDGRVPPGARRSFEVLLVMGVGDKEAEDGLVPRSQRFAVYTLLSGEHLVNYLTRFSVPYIVPFVVQQYGFSELERARLLNAFQPGYVLTQIPGSWLAENFGARSVLGMNNTVMAAVLLAIPTAGRIGGAWAVWACIFALGLVPFFGIWFV